MGAGKITGQIVEKIAKLANLILTSSQQQQFTRQLSSVIGYVSKIQKLNIANVPETSQVTGLTNVLRDDVVQPERMLTQTEALSTAKQTHNGFFVVKAIFE